MINQVFGIWDAPVTDGAEHINTPIGNNCLWCQEKIKEGDNGRIYGNTFSQIWTEHRECSFRNVMGGIGHFVNHDRYCHGELGTDAGISKRQSSLLVWALHEQVGIEAFISGSIPKDILEEFQRRVESIRLDVTTPFCTRCMSYHDAPLCE